MRSIRLQLLIVLLGLALVGLLLYGQSSGFSTQLVPAQGGIYNEGSVGSLQHWNPLSFSSLAPDQDFYRLVYSGLLRFDSTGRLQPDLAQSWAVSEDGLSYTFALRNDLTWHDGIPLTVDDVIFTIQLMQSPDFPGPKDIGALWQTVTVQKLSSQTINLKLKQAYAPFGDFLTFAILPAHIFGSLPPAELFTTPKNYLAIGTGLFMLNGVERGADGQVLSVKLASFPKHYAPVQYLDGVSLVYFATESAAVSAFQAGQIQGLGNLSRAAHKLIVQSNPQVNLFFGRQPQYSLILLNQHSEELPFFQSKKVRQALLATINRRFIAEHLLEGHAMSAVGPILPGTWAYDETLIPQAYDLDWAAKVLDEEGWRIPETVLPNTPEYVRTKNDVQFKFTWLVPDDAQSRAIAELIVPVWQKLGILVTVEYLPASEILQAHVTQRSFDAALVSLSFTKSPDPDPYPFWHNTAIETGQNYSGFENRRMSGVLEQARVTIALEDRAKLYRLFQQQFQSETPALLLYYPVYVYAVDGKVRQVQIGPLFQSADRFATIQNWYMLTRRVVSR
jgi:peptide/nickel transport system substrate-binding protein